MKTFAYRVLHSSVDTAAFFEACEDSGAPPAVSIVKPLLSI